MKLELLSVDRPKSPIVLDQLPVIVGLDPGADICLDDSSLGHYQCMIDDNDGVLTVWDLGTKLGTFVNGVRVSKTSALMSGDELTIGRSRFTVRYGETPAKPLRRDEHETRAGPRPSAPHRRRQPVAPI
jgi:pSer/pThr/pTyr-binding forkhead associated (FHA) protein